VQSGIGISSSRRCPFSRFLLLRYRARCGWCSGEHPAHPLPARPKRTPISSFHTTRGIGRASSGRTPWPHDATQASAGPPASAARRDGRRRNRPSAPIGPASRIEVGFSRKSSGHAEGAPDDEKHAAEPAHPIAHCISASGRRAMRRPRSVDAIRKSRDSGRFITAQSSSVGGKDWKP
jgi:hypothetical protein